MSDLSCTYIHATGMRTGRQLKYGEPTIKREFRLPESLNDLLTSTARKRGLNLSDIIVTALKNELEEEAVLTQDVGEGRKLYAFDLTDEDADEFQKLAKAFHIDDPQIFVKVLVSSALDAGPAAVRELLYGQFDADVDEFIAAKESAAKPKKSSRKAA